METPAYIALTVSFLLGAIPFGWIIAKLWGVSDLRKVGSSNIGATNVVRTAGVVPGALTFLFDFLKGAVPVAYYLQLSSRHEQLGPDLALWIGLTSVLGHCFSPFLSFRGGKGVSTTLGAALAFNPWLGGASILVYLLSLATTRVSALGSLFAMLCLLAGAILFLPGTSDKLAIFIMVFIVFGRHRDNWNKLLTSVFVGLLVGAQLIAFHPQDASAHQTLTDYRGKKVVFEKAPERIVALIPSLAELVIDLGYGDRLVGAPEYTSIPENLSRKVNLLGPYNNLSVETIYKLRPDLVLASIDGNEPSTVSQLEKLGLKILTINTESLSDIIRTSEMISKTLGQKDQTKIAALRKAFSKNKSTPNHETKKKVFIQVGWEPLITISKRTFIDELVRISGGDNIFSDAPTKYPRPNPEEVIAKDPEVLIICKLTASGNEAEQSRKFWLQFKNMRAVRSNQVYIVPGEWLTKPGFTLLKGLEELGKII
ncbi:MAG: glycerol-3-phosphate 1-O-acyltransferase PlsY [Bdellovibrionota bacterium]